MKKNMIFCFCLLAGAGRGQVVDSLAVVREVDSLLQLSTAFFKAEKFEEGLPIVLFAAEKSKTNLGINHPLYSTALNRIGVLYYQLSKFDQAESYWLETKDISARVLGKESAEYAQSLNNLAALYYAKGDLDKVEPLDLEAKDIRARMLGKSHPDYAQSVQNLAILYETRSEYAKAEPLYLEARDVFGKALGMESAEYANSLLYLGNLYKEMGEIAKAEPLYLKSIEISRKAIGKENSEYAHALNFLGILYEENGDYAKAEPLYLESLQITENTLGKDNPLYQQSLSNLAVLYQAKGEDDKAEPLFLTAMELCEKIFGKEHERYGICLVNLSTLYLERNELDKAEQFALEAVGIFEKIYGKGAPGYATALQSLGVVRNSQGKYTEAEAIFLECKKVIESTEGLEHPQYAVALFNLATNYKDAHQLDRAAEYYLASNHSNQALIQKAARFSSESEMFAYFQTFEQQSSGLFSFALDNRRQDAIGTTFDNTLVQKGFLLNAFIQMKNRALSDTAAIRKYQEFSDLNRRLAVEYAKPILDRKDVAQINEKANTLEKELIRTVAGFGDALRQVNWQEVQAKLQPGEAAIEFVHFKYAHPKPTDSTLYAALILLPAEASLPAKSQQAGTKEAPAPRMVFLCEQRQLDSLLRAPDPADAAARLYASRGIDPTNGKVPPVYDLIWRPLDSLLQGVKTVYYSPSGLLHKVAFNAIPTGKGKEVLSDRYRLFQVFSTRNLVVQSDPSSDTKPRSAALFGGIQYDAQWASDSTAHDSSGYISLATRLIPERRGSLGHGWGYLPSTRTEVEKVQQLLSRSNISCTVRSDTAATEEYFKTLGTTAPSPEVLHVATHGFFFPEAAQKAARNWDEAGSNFKLSDHPLLRSGLLLAGANQVWSEGRPVPGREDGILTAYELSQMNLMGTKLAVLSACETGLGDIQNNEGVFGLQRALKMAGVEKIIVSLWQVPDRETSDFMQTFYGKWLGGLTVREAFYQTQALMRRKYKEAFRWAGFVLVE